MNNMPIHSPLFTPNLTYGSDECESLSVLLEVDQGAVREFLRPTPFEFVSPHAWLEIVVLRSAFGVSPFASGGVIVPCRYGDVHGGFYAFCYIDTDDGLALGREPFGYPKKFADVRLQRTGRAATGAIYRKDAHVEMSVILSEGSANVPPVLRYPHLLLQVLPSAESSDVLLKRVIARDTGSTSNMITTGGEAAAMVAAGPAGNELAWLSSANPVYGSYARGSFRSALGKVLGTIQLGRELREARAFDLEGMARPRS